MLGVVGSILDRRSRAHESDLVSNSGGWWARIFGEPLEAESKIDHYSALTIDTVWICVNAISADIAKLPLHLYRRLSPSGRERARKHPAYPLLLNQPNPRMTAFVFRDVMQAHALNWGNAYAEIERNKAGKPIALWPLHPGRMCPELKDGRHRYCYQRVKGGDAYLDPLDVFHIRGLGFDGLRGYSVIEMARRSLAGIVATQEYGRRLYDGSAVAPGVLSSPNRLSDPARENLTKAWSDFADGPKRRKVMVAEEGLKFEKMSFSPDDSQFVEKSQFDVPTVCRWYRFPPHKAYDLTNATFSNIEHQDLAYLGETLLGWMANWEQEAWAKLLDPSEQEDYYFAHLVNALLRTDMKTRFDGYSQAINAGWLLVDEAREAEDRNPLPEGQGMIPRFPVNMTTPAKALTMPPPGLKQPSEPAPTDKPADDPAADPKRAVDPTAERRALAAGMVAQLAQSIEPMLVQVVGRLLRVEADKARQSARRNEARGWNEAWYLEHFDHVRDVVFPSVEAVARAVCTVAGVGPQALKVPAAVRDLAKAHIERSRRELHGGDLELVLATWSAERPEDQAGEMARSIASWFIKRLNDLPKECAS